MRVRSLALCSAHIQQPPSGVTPWSWGGGVAKGCEGFLGGDTCEVPRSAKGTEHMALGGSTREEPVPLENIKSDSL